MSNKSNQTRTNTKTKYRSIKNRIKSSRVMEAKTKKIIKTVLFVVFVPSIIVAGYYGVSYGITKYKEYKKKKETDLDKPENGK